MSLSIEYSSVSDRCVDTIKLQTVVPFIVNFRFIFWHSLCSFLSHACSLLLASRLVFFPPSSPFHSLLFCFPEVALFLSCKEDGCGFAHVIHLLIFLRLFIIVPTSYTPKSQFVFFGKLNTFIKCLSFLEEKLICLKATFLAAYT